MLLLESLDAGGDIEVDQLLQDRRGDQVLKAAQRRLTGQGIILRQLPGHQLENRIVPQRVVIIAVLVAGQDAKESLPQHRQKRVLPARVRILQALCHPGGVVPALIKLPHASSPASELICPGCVWTTTGKSGRKSKEN